MPTLFAAKLRQATVLVAAFLSSTAMAQILTVNISQPGAVVFTATGASAANNATSDDQLIATLKGFFTASAAMGQFFANTGSSTLTPAGSSNAVNQGHPSYQVSNFPNVLDFELLRTGATTTPNYTTSSAAFSGSVTFDLTGYSLPGAGATGNVYAADYTTVIGTYSVTSAIPEPSTYALLSGLAALGFAGYRSRRRQTI